MSALFIEFLTTDLPAGCSLQSIITLVVTANETAFSASEQRAHSPHQAQSKDPTQAVIPLTSGYVLARSGTLVWMPGNIKVSFHLATGKGL